MKRIVMLFAAAAAFSSCTVFSGDSPKHNAYSLQSNAIEIYDIFVYNPMACMIPLEEVSNYLFSMTEEEQAASPVRTNITRIGENVYYLEDFGKITTGGTSLGTVGAQWKLDAVSYPDWCNFPGWSVIGNSYYDYYSNAGTALSVTISCTSVSPYSWKLSATCANGSSEIDLATEQLEPQVVSVSVSASGAVRDDGYSAEFSTGEDALLYNVKLTYKDFSCIGQGIVGFYDVLAFGTFGMDILYGGSSVDNCTISFMGDTVTYRTSRD